MARIARVVAPGMPHHVTQRGNRRLQTFFNAEDYQAYLEVMSKWCARYKDLLVKIRLKCKLRVYKSVFLHCLFMKIDLLPNSGPVIV
jgi:hypothetical protein